MGAPPATSAMENDDSAVNHHGHWHPSATLLVAPSDALKGIQCQTHAAASPLRLTPRNDGDNRHHLAAIGRTPDATGWATTVELTPAPQSPHRRPAGARKRQMPPQVPIPKALASAFDMSASPVSAGSRPCGSTSAASHGVNGHGDDNLTTLTPKMKRLRLRPSIGQLRLQREAEDDFATISSRVQVFVQPERRTAVVTFLAFSAGCRQFNPSFELVFPPQYPHQPPQVLQVVPEVPLDCWQYSGRNVVLARLIDGAWLPSMGIADIIKDLVQALEQMEAKVQNAGAIQSEIVKAGLKECQSNSPASPSPGSVVGCPISGSPVARAVPGSGDDVSFDFTGGGSANRRLLAGGALSGHFDAMQAQLQEATITGSYCPDDVEMA